jgi:hypothetical protein
MILVITWLILVAKANHLASTGGKGQSLSMPAWKEFKANDLKRCASSAYTS